MDIFLQQLANGLTIGSMFALVALGYTMVYGVMKLINFAHGDMVAASAFVGLTIYTQVMGQATSLQEMSLLTNVFGRSLQGLVQASYEGKGKTFSGSTWKMECTVEEGEVGIVRPILGHQSLPFSQVRMLLTGNGNDVRISEGKIVSNLGNGWFNGSVQLVRPLLQSQLQLRGGLTPQPLFFQEIKATPLLRELEETLKEESLAFNLSGTVHSPAIHFENLAMQIYALDKERE